MQAHTLPQPVPRSVSQRGVDHGGEVQAANFPWPHSALAACQPAHQRSLLL